MNEIIEKKVLHCYQMVDHAIQTLGDNVEEAIVRYGGLFYERLEIQDKETISKEDFFGKVREYTFKKDPPPVLKELYVDPWLEPIWRKNEKTNWLNYKWALEKDGKEKLVAQLEADTFAILDSCKNPQSPGQWERRGLVYGHVQSGKTANYVGLVNKALDVGYKIIIILTGMTEDLRKQTQDRVNYGIIGKNEHSEKYGIGFHPTHKPESIKGATHLHFDLNSGNVDTLISNLSLDQNVVFVVKKNVSVLNNLIKWLNRKSVEQDPNHYRIINTPFFIIDDEADNASIQSLSKKDYQLQQDALEIKEIADIEDGDLTDNQLQILEKAKKNTIKAINRNIRICLSLIAQKSFVAYTATPYAVIAQRSEDQEKEWKIDEITYKIDENSDLFPEHFIIPLEPSPKYMGIEKIFGSGLRKELPVKSLVPEKDKLLFPIGKSSYTFQTIPESLEEAIIHFITAIYVRTYRNQNQHNTMLVHSSHVVEKIDYVAHKIDLYLSSLKDRIKSDPNLKLKFDKQLDKIRKNSRNELFKEHFETDLNNYKVPDEIFNSEIYKIIDRINIVSYHSKEKDPTLKHHSHKLLYPNLERHPQDSRIYIVVGGNRISRGFTLEGLTTSYFVRESGTQDTLYQMGRWFGFRIGYEDTIMIYLPKDQIAWFRDILNLELELRDDLAQMNKREMTPSMWEIKMVNSKSFEALNKKLKICDENKLRNTRKKKLSFGGTNQFTKHFKRDNQIQEANLKLTKEFINNLIDNHYITKKNLLYPKEFNINFLNIPVKTVLEYLAKYQIHPKDEILYTVQNFISLNSDLLDSFSVVLAQKNISQKNYEIQPEWRIHFPERNQIVTSLHREDKNAGEGDHYLNSNLLDSDKDNTFDIIDTDKKVIEYEKSKLDKKGSEYLYNLRNESKKAILILYIIKGKVEIDKNEIYFPSIHLSFPNIGESVEYTIRNRSIK